MNNVYYLDLAEMVIPDESRADDFSIFYRREIKFGESVDCRFSRVEDGGFVSVVGKDGTLHAQIMLYK